MSAFRADIQIKPTAMDSPPPQHSARDRFISRSDDIFRPVSDSDHCRASRHAR